jgi:hypothetical protein
MLSQSGMACHPTRVAALVLAVALALPHDGVARPGVGLGGVRLGASPATVRSAWGDGFGRCRGCSHPTWYFTYRAYAPQGAGVEFRHGRAAALFTLWSPAGWHTPAGLRIGDPSSHVGELYGPVARRDCRGYYAFVLPQRSVVTAFYVVDERVWGFGVSRRSVPVCR